jgi:SAM-dependent methyltransferase
MILNKLKHALHFPGMYRFFTTLISKNCGYRLVTEIIQPESNESILDIGCGPADIAAYLPETVKYTGFDISHEYIEAAKKRFGSRGNFICAPVSSFSVVNSFDIVIAIGVLHHLDDDEAQRLCSLAKLALKPGGKFISMDGCFEDNQNSIAEWLLKNDRGGYVRREDEYLRIIQKNFPDATTKIMRDMLRLPYTHCVMQATKSAD